MQGGDDAACAYDALIAATAIANGLPLYTCNPEDFDGIPALDVRPVPHPARETHESYTPNTTGGEPPTLLPTS